ncbi:MAG TPA: hypothetical protein VGF45_11195 [Polyangia bacterium]
MLSSYQPQALVAGEAEEDDADSLALSAAAETDEKATSEPKDTPQARDKMTTRMGANS